VHPTPPTVEKLSSLFQDFYILAANHINTHISALSSRQHRECSPSSTSSRSSAASKMRAKASSISNKDQLKLPLERKESEQQMLTSEEIAERKRARKLLEQKRVALEEAIERRVCEGIYDRIWRHRSTQDEAQDEKLRSKTAALAVVGIGLTDLGIDLGEDISEKSSSVIDERENEIRDWLDGARDELFLMNGKKYPLGKLQHLKAAHKAIVDTLSHFHPSSSADEIMPMLIYTLITSPPQGINVISNLYFIQRFRSESKIDGEAAYCLTNLEAAITFLETVDLASLRADEALSGPPKTRGRPSTPGVDRQILGNLATTLSPTSNNSGSRTPSKPEPSPSSLRQNFQLQNRRLSELFQPAQALGAAGDAMLNTADQGFKTVSNSLGESYRFLIGKLKERQVNSPDGQIVDMVVPKTLDDARRLVGSQEPEEEGTASEGSSMHSPDMKEAQKGDASRKPDKVLNLIGGRPARDHSADSVRSSGSGKKVAFAEDSKEKEKGPPPLNTAQTSSNPALVESMRSLGNTLNPMARIAGMGMMRGFGRSSAPAAKPIPDGGVADLTTVSFSPSHTSVFAVN
jgi:Vacuolar sorting protein 9 (VPS9) domain